MGAEALNVLVGCIAAGAGGGALGGAPPLEYDALGEGAAAPLLENDDALVEGGGAAAAEEDPTTELPSAKLTSLSGAVFPLKNSDAVRDGSIDGAGG